MQELKEYVGAECKTSVIEAENWSGKFQQDTGPASSEELLFEGPIRNGIDSSVAMWWVDPSFAWNAVLSLAWAKPCVFFDLST